MSTRAPSRAKTQDRMYLLDLNAPFRPLENISTTLLPPTPPQKIHSAQRRVIFADDSTRAVISLAPDFGIYHNAEIDAVLVSKSEPTLDEWKSLKSHMTAEDAERDAAKLARQRTAGRARGRAKAEPVEVELA